MKKKTLVFGASINPGRYSNFAVTRLLDYGHEVVSFGRRKGKIESVDIDTELLQYDNIDTVTLYLNAKNQKRFYDYLISLKPKRIIFNPGTENPEFYSLLKNAKIDYGVACTLVLLSTNQY